MKKIKYYIKENGKCPYMDWFNSLDVTVKVRINDRLNKLINQDYYGDFKPLKKSELSELRFNFGAGYRIYYFDLEDTLVLFLAGSDKKEQDKVIKQANKYFDDFIERNSENENND